MIPQKRVKLKRAVVENEKPQVKYGVGLRRAHYDYLLAQKLDELDLGWFEIVSENYFHGPIKNKQVIQMIREHYPVAMHGVSLNIGNAQGIDSNYLKELKKLKQDIRPFIISDHLSWVGTNNKFLQDLFPLPLTNEVMKKVLENLDKVQNYLKHEVYLENPSNYLSFSINEFEEYDFLNQIAKKAGTKILLDINNVYVSSQNLGYDPVEYLSKIDPLYIGQIHLAGYEDRKHHLFDTHSMPVYDPVWELFQYFMNIGTNRELPYMVEWDGKIPSFNYLVEEVLSNI